jgi:hypothetical protein
VVVVLYFAILFELKYQLPKYFLSSSMRLIIFYSYNALFFIVLLHFIKRNAAKFYIISVGIITAFITFLYPIGMHLDNVIIRNDYLFNNGGSLGEFCYHYVNVFFVLAALASIMKVIIAKSGIKSILMNFFYWYLIVMIVYLGSSELNHLNLWINFGSGVGYREIENSSVRIGYPVLWSVISLIIMLIGLRKSIKMLRIISLSLFLITIIKLFSYDIMDVSDGGKIIAFIILGVILLLVSFLYQKLKKIIFDSGEISENK